MKSQLTSRNQRFLANLQRIEARAEKAQRQVSSGLRVERASDDPDHISELLQARASLSRSEQIKTNLGRVKSEVDSAEAAMAQAVKIMEDVRTVGAQAITGTQSAETRKILADRVGTLFRQLVGAANTQQEGRYIFAGNNDQSAPYALDNTGVDGVTAYAGGAATRQVEDDTGLLIPIARAANQIFQNSDPTKNVFRAVHALQVSLAANDEAAYKVAFDDVSSALKHLNSELGWFGNAQEAVNSALDHVQTRTMNLKVRISDLQDADLAEAILEMQTANTVRQAALQAKAQEDRRTLFDFIR